VECSDIREQVTMKPANMRTDFLLRDPATGRRIALEVKNVVCSDHPPAAVQRRDAALRAQGVKKVRGSEGVVWEP
jgi:DNA-binding sugar fermentation-stimulating protein